MNRKRSPHWKVHCPGCWSKSGANGTGQHNPDLGAQAQQCEDEFCTREGAWYGAEFKQGKKNFRIRIIQAWEIKNPCNMSEIFFQGSVSPIGCQKIWGGL